MASNATGPLATPGIHDDLSLAVRVRRIFNVRPADISGLAADTSEEWICAIEGLMVEEAKDVKWRARVDAFLAQNSWDITWMKMRRMMEARIATRQLTESASMAISQLRSAAQGD